LPFTSAGCSTNVNVGGVTDAVVPGAAAIVVDQIPPQLHPMFCIVIWSVLPVVAPAVKLSEVGEDTGNIVGGLYSTVTGHE
jgi:hypothetical protein